MKRNVSQESPCTLPVDPGSQRYHEKENDEEQREEREDEGGEGDEKGPFGVDLGGRPLLKYVCVSLFLSDRPTGRLVCLSVCPLVAVGGMRTGKQGSRQAQQASR